MAFVVRRVVSKNKRRYRDAGFDLDLAYIHDRIIAMGAPCEGREALYRNPMDQVQRFLARRHGTRCRVYNLCAERAYDCTRLGAQVVRYPLEDHQAAPLHIMQAFCIDATAYLAQHQDNVIAVHCKAGKGRTGMLICALLLHLKICPDAQAAMDLYALRRTHDGRGLTIPSQRRFVQYFDHFRMHGQPYHGGTPHLQQVHIVGLSEKVAQGATLVVHERGMGEIAPRPVAVVVATHTMQPTVKRAWSMVNNNGGRLEVEGRFTTVTFTPPLPLQGDVKIQVFSSHHPRKSNSLFHTWLSPAFHHEDASEGVVATRDQLDRVKSKVPDNILLQVKFVFEKARHGDDASPAEGEGPPVPAKVPPLHVAAPLESSTIIPAGIEDNATGQVTAFAVEEGDGVDSEKATRVNPWLQAEVPCHAVDPWLTSSRPGGNSSAGALVDGAA